MTRSVSGESDDRARPVPGSGLLDRLSTSGDEAEYEAAATARASTRGATSNRIAALAAVAVFGVLLGVSAIKTERDRPQALVERTRLIAAIHVRQTRLDGLHSTLRSLQGQVAALQTQQASVTETVARLAASTSTLGVAAAALPVRGPGIVITADNARDAVPGAGGVIRDSDLQALVNGLWAAGAEAIAVNGHRLSALTAIRFAGQAITVDYRSLNPPYLVEAIGDPDTLPARFLETSGGQTWLGLRANFGIGFQTRSAAALELPGDSRDSLLWARRWSGR